MDTPTRQGNGCSPDARSVSRALQRDTLWRLALTVAASADQAWLREARARMARCESPMTELTRLSSIAGRALEYRLVGEPIAIHASAGEVNLGSFSLVDLARLVLLLEALDGETADGADWLRDYFRAGDKTEQLLVLRALALLDDDGRLKPIALDAGRRNDTALFAALALDNPYPAAYYDEREFNQLVLKALFLEQPLARVRGLAARANSELSRMCEDYAQEREAAGRAVPGDIWLALLPCASQSGRALAGRYGIWHIEKLID